MQVENVLPLLKKGIGIHHGGLLPLLKETIEILFAEGLIKVNHKDFNLKKEKNPIFVAIISLLPEIVCAINS